MDDEELTTQDYLSKCFSSFLKITEYATLMQNAEQNYSIYKDKVCFWIVILPGYDYPLAFNKEAPALEYKDELVRSWGKIYPGHITPYIEVRKQNGILPIHLDILNFDGTFDDPDNPDLVVASITPNKSE